MYTIDQVFFNFDDDSYYIIDEAVCMVAEHCSDVHNVLNCILDDMMLTDKTESDINVHDLNVVTFGLDEISSWVDSDNYVVRSTTHLSGDAGSMWLTKISYDRWLREWQTM